MRLDVEARSCGFLVVDAQVERGDRARTVERELDGHAAALVELDQASPGAARSS
jgi:hypothetical protein